MVFWMTFPSYVSDHKQSMIFFGSAALPGIVGFGSRIIIICYSRVGCIGALPCSGMFVLLFKLLSLAYGTA